jgi:predicted AAA+ superfamily ATPase
MIKRRLSKQLKEALNENASVALLGPRQVGKTTLAMQLLSKGKSVYIDLENDLDKRKVEDFHTFYEAHKGKLIILDEIQRLPEIFSSIRGIIDEQRRAGNKKGLFLFLGSASMELLKQSKDH